MSSDKLSVLTLMKGEYESMSRILEREIETSNNEDHTRGLLKRLSELKIYISVLDELISGNSNKSILLG
jgi:hypothetical protein